MYFIFQKFDKMALEVNSPRRVTGRGWGRRLSFLELEDGRNPTA
jgi:hypothetical protein